MAAYKNHSKFPADDVRAISGLYTIREAAAYLNVPKSTIHSWTSPRVNDSPLLSALPKHGNEPTIPFIGLAEGFVLAAFRRAGVPLQRIRPAVELLKKEIGLEHALASKNLCTDGAEILFDYDHHLGNRSEVDAQGSFSDLYVVRTKQRQFSATVRDYLRRISYGGDGWAIQVNLPSYHRANVIVNPEMSFGQPIIANGRVRVEDVVDRFAAGDSVAEIAGDFEVSAVAVEDVIRVATRVAA